MTSDQTNLSANWNYPTAVQVGAGRVRELAALCQQHGISNPLVVTDKGTAGLPFMIAIMSDFQDAGLGAALFDAVDSNPSVTNVEEGAEAFRTGGHDGVVALGGGSGLDAGKAVALYAGQSRPLRDFEDAGDNWLRVNEAGVAPVIAVPTTAGTGSEVGRASVITFPDTQEKKIIFHPKMLPVAVLSDPELTVGLPAGLTAATGLDAFTHCFEAYCAPGYHPMADGIALEGIRLIKEWLPVAYKQPGHIKARTHMLVAASMGATAFQKGLGAVHALSHPVGAFYGTHHGLANAVFLPYVMLKNRPVIEGSMARLGAFLDLEKPGFDSVFRWVLEFRALFDIPNTADVLGVLEDDIPALAAAAEADPSMGGNPQPLDRDELAGLFRQALAGNFSPA